jgi:ribosome-binding protein aMBF1 (putative translation factor)
VSNLGNKPVMAKNIKYHMKQKGINAKELSKALNVPYTTVLSWTKAEYYPRIDKIEMMSDYFGILKSDLIEDKQKQPAQDELSYKKREFIRKVEGMSEAQIERLEQILALVENTEL